jgi:hypothetical protein
MPKAPEALSSLPPAASRALAKLGENLAIARVRRRETQRAWAKRLGVSIPTLIRLEHGDPGVGLGIVATALWMLGRVQALPELADPGHDRGALEHTLQVTIGSVRSGCRRRTSSTGRGARDHFPGSKR